MYPDIINNQRLLRGNRCTYRANGRVHRPSSRSVTSTHTYRCPSPSTDNFENRSGHHSHYRPDDHLRYPYRRNNRFFGSPVRDFYHRKKNLNLRRGFDGHQVARTIPSSGSSTNNLVNSTYPIQTGSSESDISSSAQQKPLATSKLSHKLENHDDLRSNLIDGLRNSTYQCMICISRIRATDPIWSCATCYNIYHLLCIRSWAKKSFQQPNIECDSTSVWRCPSCQTNHELSPELISYRCFCGRIESPEFHPGRTTIPHGCDQICSKVKRITSTSNFCDYQCTHLCTE
ncbi:unnamed protein product [Schistosoma turkestanicum]|nr:unnamed protein product [Schistosoma turkestanicum]